MPGTIKQAQQALDRLPEDDHHRRGTPAALLGLAFWADGDLSAALRSFTQALTSYQKAGNILFVITGVYPLAEMKMGQGHLREAVQLYEDALQLAEEHGEPVLRGAADLYTGVERTIP
jgi:LuxR family maltose regulon positive regulatory protein